jgi:hypothetical protein
MDFLKSENFQNSLWNIGEIAIAIMLCYFLIKFFEGRAARSEARMLEMQQKMVSKMMLQPQNRKFAA